jgi:predicted RNase H-like HicB family nuclease
MGMMVIASRPGLEDLPLEAKILGASLLAIAFSVYVFVSLKLARRRYKAAFQKVMKRTPWPDDAFVRELGLVSETKAGEIAVGLRRALAEWFHIPAGALRANSSLTADPDLSPLGDSLDVVELELLMEQQANLVIPSSVYSAIAAPSYKDNLEESIQSVLKLVTYPSPETVLTIRIKYYRQHWLAKVPAFHGTVIHAPTRDEALASAKSVATYKLAQRLGRIVPKSAVNFIVEEA